MATVYRSNAPGTRQGEREAALIDLRHTLDWMGDEVHVIGAPVDPIVEMAAISKAFDNSKALVAENVRGYPDARLISNLWATKERCARLFGVDEFRDIKFKLLDSLRAPIAPREVARDEAPCQEIVLERDAIARIEDVLPLCTHTEDDGGRFFGNGVHFIGPPWVPGGGTQFSFYRMAFREGQEYASVNMVPGGQGDAVCRRWPGEKIPVTVKRRSRGNTPAGVIRAWGATSVSAVPIVAPSRSARSRPISMLNFPGTRLCSVPSTRNCPTSDTAGSRAGRTPRIRTPRTCPAWVNIPCDSTNGAAPTTSGCASATPASDSQSSSARSNPAMVACEAKPRIRSRSSRSKPFMTESTVIRAVAPSAIPIIDVRLMNEMK